MVADKIGLQIKKYRSISLEEMDGVSLMDRIDTKYVFPIKQVPFILEKLSPNHRVLEINSERWFSYQTTYFDTSGFTMFMAHVTRRSNRQKVRLRHYVNTNTAFLEIKKKNGAGKTSKKRIKATFDESNISEANTFILEHTNFQSTELKPALENSFKRITLVNDAKNMRITLDTMLAFNYDGTHIELPNIAIMEMKHDKGSSRSECITLLRHLGIRPSGFSKYCIGAGLLHDNLKKNFLKPYFIKINNINNESVNYV